jgi:hypothetical protein
VNFRDPKQAPELDERGSFGAARDKFNLDGIHAQNIGPEL